MSATYALYSAFGEAARPAEFVKPPPGVLERLAQAAAQLETARTTSVSSTFGYPLPPSDNLGRIVGEMKAPVQNALRTTQ